MGHLTLLLRRFLAPKEAIQEPLCASPKGGEVIQYDEEERAAIAIGLKDHISSKEVIIRALKDGGMDMDNIDFTILNNMDFTIQDQDSVLSAKKRELMSNPVEIPSSPWFS